MRWEGAAPAAPATWVRCEAAGSEAQHQEAATLAHRLPGETLGGAAPAAAAARVRGRSTQVCGASTGGSQFQLIGDLTERGVAVPPVTAAVQERCGSCLKRAAACGRFTTSRLETVVSVRLALLQQLSGALRMHCCGALLGRPQCLAEQPLLRGTLHFCIGQAWGYRWICAGVREPTERFCLHCPPTLQSIHRVSLIDSLVESL